MPPPLGTIHKTPLFELRSTTIGQSWVSDKSSALCQNLVGIICHLLTFPTKWHTQVSNILVS